MDESSHYHIVSKAKIMHEGLYSIIKRGIMGDWERTFGNKFGNNFWPWDLPSWADDFSEHDTTCDRCLSISEWNNQGYKIKKGMKSKCKIKGISYFSIEQTEPSYFIQGRKNRKKLIKQYKRRKSREKQVFLSYNAAIKWAKVNPNRTFRYIFWENIFREI